MIARQEEIALTEKAKESVQKTPGSPRTTVKQITY